MVENPFLFFYNNGKERERIYPFRYFFISKSGFLAFYRKEAVQMDKDRLDAFLRQIRLEERATNPEIQNRMSGSMIHFAEDLRLHGQTSRLIRLSTHGRFQPTPPHSHDYIEVMYLYDGSVTHHWDNGQATLIKGDFFFIPPGMPHWTDTCGAGDIAVNLILSTGLFDGGMAAARWLGEWYAECRKGNGQPLLLHTGMSAARDTVCRMMQEAFDPDGFSGEVVEQLFPVLLLDIRRGSDGLREMKERNVLYGVVRYIESRYRTVTLAETAAHFGYTPGYLSARMKRELGQSFSEFRQSFCMAQAALLLRESELPVTEVASQSGFTNMTHFYRLFDRAFHQTPADYRASAQKSAKHQGLDKI